MAKGKSKISSQALSEEDAQNETLLQSSGKTKNRQPKNQNQPQGNPKIKDTMPPIPHKDLFQRINYSYQASIFLQSLGANSNTTSSKSISNDGIQTHDVGMKIDRKGKRRAIEYDHNLEEAFTNNGDDPEILKRKFRQLSRMNIREMNIMTAHNQLKLDPSLKRSLCKSCGTVLIPGLTSRIRNRPNLNSFSTTHHTCLTCSSSLSLPCPPIPLHAYQPSVPGGGATHSIQPLSNEDNLDGPVRFKRRLKASKRGKRVFHEIEKSHSDPSGVGHVLWKGDEKVENWGIPCSTNNID
ncbi:uncharacterized protein I206_102449 [Kwoniella pini CBS 10737]|uniref:Uncharacterized protein n=1 Tax=Kwoniella pini CBS 10737 TaxID=1296096 RepID=A0A1B9I5D2_9TREE|nr:uncharacterized protein I206_02799 [Kwoniella pini CBS 10737]OCF50743.1 hypothetical protein I206_02799 [Kwoniella pini CBS 10737]